MGTCIFDTACDRHSNETATFRKYVAKYKNMRKLKINFLRKSQGRGDKITRVNSIRITYNLSIYFDFVRCWILLS